MHQFPDIRTALFAALEHLKVKPAIRNTAQLSGPGFALKRWVIRHSGAQQLRVALQIRDLPHNAALLGACDFRGANYRALMQAWLAALPQPGGLLFCHPGTVPVGRATDPIRAARQCEFAYLGSEDFIQDLASANVTPA